jgi:hypothetical protein
VSVCPCVCVSTILCLCDSVSLCLGVYLHVCHCILICLCVFCLHLCLRRVSLNSGNAQRFTLDQTSVLARAELDSPFELSNCLSSFAAEERMEADAWYVRQTFFGTETESLSYRRCGRCKDFRSALKMLRIWRPPKLLVSASICSKRRSPRSRSLCRLST